MKVNIVVCCENMLKDLANKAVVFDGKLNITPVNPQFEGDFRFCPRCGKELPFEHEEENRFGEEK